MPHFSNYHVPKISCLKHPQNTKSFVLHGDVKRKKFKYANLDIAATRNVFLHSIQFIYDLKTTDSEFEISVVVVDGNKRKNFYIDKVVMNTKGSDSHVTYKFMHQVEIPAGEKVWIRIEFPKQEYRQTYHHFDFWPFSTGSDIELRRTSYYSYAEIIHAIFYTVK